MLPAWHIFVAITIIIIISILIIFIIVGLSQLVAGVSHVKARAMSHSLGALTFTQCYPC